MIKVAICDFDMQFRKKIRLLCEAYFEKKGLEFQLSQYSSGEELLVEDNPDILILGVRLKRMNGIFVKEILEGTDADTRIIFVSDNRNYMSEAFGKNVYGYLVKPIKEELLYKKLDDMLSDIYAHSKYVFCNNKGEIEKVRFKDIIYIEIRGRRTTIHVRSKENEDHSCTAEMTLKRWEGLLPSTQFIRVNKQQIINLAYVVDIKYGIELIDQTKISVGAIYEERVWEKINEFQPGRKIIRRNPSHAGGSTGKIY